MPHDALPVRMSSTDYRAYDLILDYVFKHVPSIRRKPSYSRLGLIDSQLWHQL
jgi:hypothetical protein